MFFDVALTIPANTPALVPLIQEVTLPPGVIQQVDVQFPLGCVGLVHTLCRRGSHQVWPTNDSGNFSSNGQTITWAEDYELNDAPFVLRLFGWNTDDTFPHTVSWRFSMRQLATPAAQQLAQQRFDQAIATLEVPT
jgi:hypothetical protein